MDGILVRLIDILDMDIEDELKIFVYEKYEYE